MKLIGLKYSPRIWISQNLFDDSYREYLDYSFVRYTLPRRLYPFILCWSYINPWKRFLKMCDQESPRVLVDKVNWCIAESLSGASESTPLEISIRHPCIHSRLKPSGLHAMYHLLSSTFCFISSHFYSNTAKHLFYF